jgi:acetyl-CoA C-acetyltransferase
MREVFIIGTGCTAVGEHWQWSLRQLAWRAVAPALQQAGIARPDAVFVGNFLAGQLSGQEHMGALIADYCGLRGVEAMAVEAAQASGAAALRQAVMAVRSGLVDSALVVGVEKLTDTVGSAVENALASAGDADWELGYGSTLTASTALILQRYLHQNQIDLRDMAGFSVNAHANGRTNPLAMFRNAITADAFLSAPMIADPITMFDSAPDADGAAAVVVVAGDKLPNPHQPKAQLLASAIATDALAVHDRTNPLFFRASEQSALKAYSQANLRPADIDLFELHDAYTVFAALTLEATGFAAPGYGWQLAANGEIGLHGRIPIATLGGLKARGNPAGASGVYQVVEVVRQLWGQAGANQVPNAQIGMAQALGGTAGTAVTHILANR